MPPLSVDQVKRLSLRGPLSTTDVTQLATGNTALPQGAPQQPPQPRLGNQSVNQQPQTGDQSMQFGLALRELLKKAQGMGTANFAEQGFNAQDQQYQRQAYTAPGLIGASPSMQAGARNAEVGALNPTIQGARQGAQTFSEQLGSFKENIDSTLGLLKEEESRMDRERDDARQLVNQALTTFGSKGFDVIDKKYLSLAGYDPKTINLAKETLKERELEAKLAAQPKSDYTPPNSYKEWELAGGQQGTGKTYSQFLADSNVKAPTAAQQTVSTYASRIEQANPIIESAAQEITSMNPAVFEAQRRLPSYLQTATYQQFDQAARNFINAVLRRESGAVISPSEFDNAYRQYLPRSGDTAETLKQKKQNRDIVYASLKNAAGASYQSVDELLGTSGGTVQMSGPKGTFNVPSNQVANFEQNGYKRI